MGVKFVTNVTCTCTSLVLRRGVVIFDHILGRACVCQ